MSPLGPIRADQTLTMLRAIPRTLVHMVAFGETGSTVNDDAAPGGGEHTIVLVDLGGYDVAWAESGTAFGNAVAIALSENKLPATYGRMSNGFFHCAVQDEPAYGRLVSIPVERGIHCLLVSQGTGISEAVVVLWREVISRAVDAVKEYRLFFWSALVGPSPRSVRSNYALAEPASIGPIELKPGDQYMRELARSPLDDKMSRTEWGSWPAVVNGTVRAADRDLATDIALEHLYRVCGLLGVAWDAWWTVRNGPYAWPDQSHELPVPEAVFTDELALFTSIADTPAPKKRTAPPWFNQAWSALEKLPHLQIALGSFYEAIQLSVLHPSFATVGFVAAVECVGAGPTSNAEGKIKDRPQARAAFSAGLKSVTSDDAARKITSAIYGRRSSTAHTGKVHANEARFGMWPNIYFGPNPSTEFYEEASRMRQLSRIILANALIRGAKN